MFKLWKPGAFCSVPYFSLHVRSNCQRPERLVNGWWFLIPNYPTYIKLVGCIPTPLKNISSSVGVIIPNIWKHRIHVPNHQPERVAEFSVDIDQTGFLRWDSRWKHQGRWPFGALVWVKIFSTFCGLGDLNDPKCIFFRNKTFLGLGAALFQLRILPKFPSNQPVFPIFSAYPSVISEFAMQSSFFIGKTYSTMWPPQL